MKKSTNPVAIIVWAVAILLLISMMIVEPYLHYLQMKGHSETVVPEGYFYVEFLISNIRLGLVAFGLLAGIGTLIELVDQIRWDALHKDR